MLLALLNFLDPALVRNLPITVAPCAQWGPLAYRAERLGEFFSARWTVAPNFIVLAREAWRQYTASDPRGLNDMATRLRDQSAVPLGSVLSRVLEEYPAVSNGLSQTEEKMLQYVGEGNSIARIVGYTMGNSEEQSVWRTFDFRKARTDSTLSSVRPSPNPRTGTSADKKSYIRSKSGQSPKHLAGRCDYINANGLDRWVGGVHLHGRSVPWRYSPETRRLVEA